MNELRNRSDNHLLNLLHDEQQRMRHISEEAIIRIASERGLARAQVEAVVEFYSFFSREPLGRFDIKFSDCPCCGDLLLMHRLCARLGVSEHETRADGLVSVSRTSCIGMCDHGASALINGTPVHSLNSERIDAIAGLIEAGTPLDAWPAEWLAVADHIRRTELLLGEVFVPGSAIGNVLNSGADEALEQIRFSDLRGRGGAGFATAQKWQFCREAKCDMRYVICNADEGEPGTFKDRVLLNSQADAVIEGMTVCARIIGAEQGFIYLRAEYRYLLKHLQTVLNERRSGQLLGNNIKGQDGFNFDIDIVVGAGAYVCGEESALIESLEEKPGNPRIRPPFPVTNGYQACPTVVNNVETLAAAAGIVAHGGRWFRGAGTWQSRGTKILSISGDCERPGIYEYPFGITVAEVLDNCCARNVQAVQIGGPSGRLIDPGHFDHRIAFEDLATGGSFMIFGDSRDLPEIILGFSHFFAHESCGFCTPCRVGTRLLRNGMQKLVGGHATAHDLDEMKEMIALISERSHCGLGMTAPNPIRDGLKYFPELFEAKLANREREPAFNLDASLGEARAITRRDDAGAHL